MKEKIYTIPVNEAFEKNCECPLCLLHKQLEKESVEYVLGAAMMEPDFRENSNEKGFCNRHYNMMIKSPNKLSLALVLDTHMESVRKKMNNTSKCIDALKNEKGGFLKKSSPESLKKVTDAFDDIEKSCVVCDKVNQTMERYIDVLFYMWMNDDKFREKFKKSKGFCIPHFKELCIAAFKYLKHDKAYEFVKIMYDKEIVEFDRLQEEIHKFTLKFDYRNKDMEWGTAQDSPQRTVEKLSGHMIDEDTQDE